MAVGSQVPGLIEYRNMPGVIGALVSARIATLAELQTVYGVEDAYDLLELLTVDASNQRIAREHYEREAQLHGNRR